MPELESITVKGFKSIASIEDLKLGPINLLIGPNGSGKSNFIEVFEYLRAIRQGELRNYVERAGGANRLLHFGSRVTRSMHLHVVFRDQVNEYLIDLEATEEDGLYPAQESVYFWDRRRYPSGGMGRPLAPHRGEAGISNPANRGIASYVRDHMDRWRVYHFHDTSTTSPMKQTGEVDDNRFLRSDGANLAAFLYLLKMRKEPAYDLIRQTVQLVAPFFEDFALEPSRLNPDKIRLEWRHKGTDAYFSAASLSDGTLRFIALATLFLQPDFYRPSVILLDEPELGLHPAAIALLAALIKQAPARNVQVIVSTQSSLLLDYFDPEDVLVADRVNGGTQLTRLDSSDLSTWLEDYSLGQLWEKNELGGRPAPEGSRG